MRILYVIGKYITFPGAYLRAFWEHMTCLLLGLPVENTGYLRSDEMCGHIEHFLPKKAVVAYISATAPGFMGLVTGLPLVVLGVLNLRFMGVTFADSDVLPVLYIILIYIGASIMCCLHPQFEVAQNLWDITLEKIRSKDKKSVIGGAVMFLPALVTYIGAVLERFSVPVFVWVAGLVFMLSGIKLGIAFWLYMLCWVLAAGIRGGFEGFLHANMILVPKIIKYKVMFYKNLKKSRVLTSDNEDLTFERNGKKYSYSEFLRLQTILYYRFHKKALDRDSYKTFETKNKSAIKEIDYYATNAARILKEKQKNYEAYAKVTTEWIIKNREKIALSSDPIVAFEELSQLDFSKTKILPTTDPNEKGEK